MLDKGWVFLRGTLMAVPESHEDTCRWILRPCSCRSVETLRGNSFRVLDFGLSCDCRWFFTWGSNAAWVTIRALSSEAASNLNLRCVIFCHDSSCSNLGFGGGLNSGVETPLFRSGMHLSVCLVSRWPELEILPFWTFSANNSASSLSWSGVGTCPPEDVPLLDNVRSFESTRLTGSSGE